MHEAVQSGGLRTPRRVLLIGPPFPPGQVSGLALALADLAQQLRARGWQIDEVVAASTPGQGTATTASPVLRSTLIQSVLAPLQRWLVFHRLWQHLPLPLRRLVQSITLPRRFSVNASDNLQHLAELLAHHQHAKLVLLCVDGSPPGATALALDLHERVALISLYGLFDELTRRRGIYRFVSWQARTPLHPYLFRRVDPAKVQLAIFASRAWQADAIEAGLPATVARTIYFGVPIPQVQPHPQASGGRLLWVGRLAPGKGLHIVLRALPHIRKHIPAATLTVVAADWSTAYRQLIARLIKRYNLQAVVQFRPAVPRGDLQAMYAEHDLLVFHSVFAEPVAFVLMEAMAAGLPVVSSFPRTESALVRDNETCVCYNPRSTTSLAAAVRRLHDDAPLRRRLAANAQRLVRERYGVDAMGQAFDAVLSEYVS